MYCRTTLASPKPVDLENQRPFQPEKYNERAPTKRRRKSVPESTVKPKKKPNKGTIDVENVATTLRKQAVKGLKLLERRELIAAAPLQIVKGGIQIQIVQGGIHMADVLLQTSEEMFTFAAYLGMPNPPNIWASWIGPLQWTCWIRPLQLTSWIGPLQWTLRVIASCLRIVQRETELVQHLDESEEVKRMRWEKGILVLNRMVCHLGPIGLKLYDAYAKINYMLGASTRDNQKVDTRDAVADRTATVLHHEVAAAWQGNVRVFYLPYAIEMILESKVQHAKICEMLGLDKFSHLQVKSPFVQLEQVEAQFPQEPGETEEDKVLGPFLIPEYFPVPNPLGDMDQYREFTTSHELQIMALIAGACQRGYDPVPSGTDSKADLWGYQWSPKHTPVVPMIISFLIESIFFKPGPWTISACRAVHHNSGCIPTPVGKIQIVIPTTMIECNISLGMPKQCEACLGIRKQCEVCLDDDTFGMVSVTWNFRLLWVLNSKTCLSTRDPIDYISILLPVALPSN